MTTTVGPQLETFYCSLRSRESGEDVFGTASVGDFWVLVEYAGLWAPHALEGSTLPVAVKSRLTSLAKSDKRSRVLFVRRGRVGTDHISLFAVRSRERDPSVVRFRLRRYDELLEIDFAALAAGEAAGGEHVDEPLFLVCTHGRRDKCCAKFGWPLYRALRESEGEAVWQSSHVGGDRFAANLVCFPHGLFYARVDDDSGRRVVEEYRRGHILPENYRGRACYLHPAQAAEYFVRRETGLTGLEELRHVGTERLDAARRRVTFASADGETLHAALVTRRESDFSNPITCHAHEARSVPQYVLEDYHARSTRTRASA